MILKRFPALIYIHQRWRCPSQTYLVCCVIQARMPNYNFKYKISSNNNKTIGTTSIPKWMIFGGDGFGPIQKHCKCCQTTLYWYNLIWSKSGWFQHHFSEWKHFFELTRFFPMFLYPIRFIKLASKFDFEHWKCLVFCRQFFVSVMDTACVSDGQMHIFLWRL